MNNARDFQVLTKNLSPINIDEKNRFNVRENQPNPCIYSTWTTVDIKTSIKFFYDHSDSFTL